MAVSGMAQVRSISPTVCGITVGLTTKTGKSMPDWNKILAAYRPMRLLTSSDNHEVRIGNFDVEGLKMSVLDMELVSDTVYRITFFEESPYADCWDAYKNLAYKLRDKYAHFEDVIEPTAHESDSIVEFYKTDGKTTIHFVADPHGIEYSLNDKHLMEVKASRIADAFIQVHSGRTGPNYDEKNKVTSIAGVKFGETRIKTIDAFKQRGTFLESEGKLSYFSDVNFGGSTYNLVTLHFNYDPKRNDMTFSAAKFEKNFYEWRREEAEMTYASIVSTFQDKYTNCTVLKDEVGGKCMVCGMLQDDYAEGKIPPIMISLELGVSRGGDKYYYVTVTYFGMNMSDSATEDI